MMRHGDRLNGMFGSSKRGFTLIELPAVRKRGFTLIELLVVIAIISLLIAILLPALSAARRSARFTVCLTHMRSFGQAWTTHAVDHKGVSVYTNNGSRTNGWLYHAEINGIYTTAGQIADPVDRANLRQTGDLYEYLNGEDAVYHCPEDVGPFEDIRNPIRDLTSYIFNSQMMDFNALPKFVGRKMEQLRPDAIFLFEVDENRGYQTGDNGYWNDGANRPNEYLSQRHIDGAPVARVDGSSERMDYSEFYGMSERGAQRPNALWFSP